MQSASKSFGAWSTLELHQRLPQEELSSVVSSGFYTARMTIGSDFSHVRVVLFKGVHCSVFLLEKVG